MAWCKRTKLDSSVFADAFIRRNRETQRDRFVRLSVWNNRPGVDIVARGRVVRLIWTVLLQVPFLIGKCNWALRFFRFFCFWRSLAVAFWFYCFKSLPDLKPRCLCLFYYLKPKTNLKLGNSIYWLKFLSNEWSSWIYKFTTFINT